MSRTQTARSWIFMSSLLAATATSLGCCASKPRVVTFQGVGLRQANGDPIVFTDPKDVSKVTHGLEPDDIATQPMIFVGMFYKLDQSVALNNNCTMTTAGNCEGECKPGECVYWVLKPNGTRVQFEPGAWYPPGSVIYCDCSSGS